jgi:CTP:molybdopterin cytidylyltransferase MocA
VDAVVMAAGEGRRLRPITERWPKPVLPIDGRPVLATLLHEVARARPERVWLVTGHLAEQVERLAGDGSAFGLDIRFVRQPEPLGSADAVRRAVEAGAGPPLLVTAADTVYTDGDLALARSGWEASGRAAGLGVRELAPPALGHHTPIRVEGGLLVELGTPHEAGEGPALTAAPLWFLGAPTLARLESLEGPPYELADAVRAGMAAGEEVQALPLGPTRDLTNPGDVVARNFPYLWA